MTDNDMQPLMDNKDGSDQDIDSPEKEFDPNSCTGRYEAACSKPEEDERFIWTIEDLVKENRERKARSEI